MKRLVFKYIAVLALLISAVVLPVLALGVVTGSTVKEVDGRPAILQVDDNYTQEAGRIFSKATVYPEAIVSYLIIST